jgi:hypothetical protein
MQTSLDSYVTRHLRFGWWSLFVFAALGLCLELMHSFKLGFYLDVSNETRRFMWTLAHAHGVLLGLIHVAFAATLRTGLLAEAPLGLASNCLIAASILLPGGFFVGGIVVHGGDPGLGILAVPLGALLLLAALLLVARGTMTAPRGDDSATPSRKRSPRRSSSG